MQNILVTTLGSWAIIPELLGFTNPGDLDLYANHSQSKTIEAVRRQYDIKPVDAVWVVTTDEQEGHQNPKSRLEDWNSELLRPFLIKFFLLKGVCDLTDRQKVRAMTDLIYRVVLHASEETARGQLLLSLAGGRKTMSADMQRAGHIFGCHAMLHVIDSGRTDARLKSFDYTAQLPLDIADAYMPLVTSGRLPRMTILDVEPQIKARDFPIQKEPHSARVGQSIKLVDALEKLQKKARSILVNYTKSLIGDRQRSNFRVLYTLEPLVLKALQSERIGSNRDDKDNDLELLKKLPKAELHCHLGGILSPAEMIEVAGANIETINVLRKENPAFAHWLQSIRSMVEHCQVDRLREKVPNVKRLRRDLFTAIPEPYTVAGFLTQFKDYPEVLEDFVYGKLIPDGFSEIGIEKYEQLGDLQGSALLQSEASLRAVCSVLVRKCKQENIRYLELRHSPIKYTRGGLEALKVVSIIREELEKAEETDFRAIFIASRHGEEREIEQHVELALQLIDDEKMSSNWIVGFDLAGAEYVKSPAALRAYFLPLMEKCINLTIHAGENEPVQNIWEAVYHLSADRIGHGLTLNEMHDLKKRFLDRKIAIEMCPSSNHQIVGYNHRTYPLKRYLDEGLRVTINTDNPGISRTSLSKEYYMAAQLSENGLTLWDVLQLIRNSFQAVFLPFSERRRLLLEAEEQILTVIDGL